MIVAVVLGAVGVGYFMLASTGIFGYFRQIHDRSEYPNNVEFYGSVRGADWSLIPFVVERAKRSYWNGKWTKPGAISKCPLSLEVDGKTWKPEDFEFDAFLKQGAVDTRIEVAKYLKSEVHWEMAPTANYYANSIPLTIHCTYTKDKVLTEVEFLAQGGPPERRAVQDLPKEFRVTIPQGTVTFPADHADLVRALGQPVKYTPTFKQHVSRIP